jgi:hypothetical protein
MKRIPGVVALMVLVMAAQAADAADLRVRVFERGASKPLAGVAVCLGTQARIDQFGAQTTDERGYAVFESLPGAQLLVTASKRGFKSEQEKMVTSNTNRLLVLSLTSGGGGPSCTSARAAPEATQGLRVTRFAVNGGAAVTASRRVALDNSVSGAVTQYRASEHADFSGANWQTYSPAPAFELSPGNGMKRVYFQVRRHSTLDDAMVETLSPVTSDTVMLGNK